MCAQQLNRELGMTVRPCWQIDVSDTPYTHIYELAIITSVVAVYKATG